MCEAYARYPVFLNRTNQGLVKRSKLEEAKGPEEANAIGKELRCQPKVRLSIPIAASASSKNVLQQDVVRRQNLTTKSMPLLPSNAHVSEVQLISDFWECYIPLSSSAQAVPHALGFNNRSASRILHWPYAYRSRL